jgi:lysozyme
MTKPLRIDGVDISHYQSGKIDWAAAKKAGVKFVFHKATQDDDYADDRYSARRKELKAAGLPFGAYHFAEPAKGDAAEEAKHFLELAKPAPGDLRPVLDLEENDHNLSRADLTRWVGTWVATVKKAVGVSPIIYTSYDLDDTFGCLLWQPRYNDTNTPPETASPWKRWDIWQFSNGQYGVPNSVPGVGHCDINHMRDGLTVNDLLIPEVEVTEDVKYVHVSLQVSDTPEQQKADAKKVFTRFADADIISGTEAGPASDLAEYLAAEAKEADFRFHKHPGGSDVWIAVNRKLIKGDWQTDYQPVVDGVAGKFAGKGLLTVSFESTLGRRISVGAAHHMFKGQRPGDPYYADNLRLTAAIGQWAREAGRGSAIVFYAGDTNTVDRTEDVFHGAPLTTAWDELGRYENTGHGNIDVIASFDPDKGVTAVSCVALDDTELRRFTDHFPVIAVFAVKVPKEAA